jgi:hypothetical protein
MARGDKIPNRAGMNVREGFEFLGGDFKVDIKRYPRLKGDELNKAREMKRFAATAATFGLANDNGTPFLGTVGSLRPDGNTLSNGSFLEVSAMDSIKFPSKSVLGEPQFPWAPPSSSRKRSSNASRLSSASCSSGPPPR